MAFHEEQIPAPSGLVPNGNIAIAKGVGFQPQSVLIDNYTAYWLYIPDANSYIAPFYTGTVKPLRHSTDYVQIQYKSPFTVTQNPTDVSYFVYAVWTDAVVAPAPGVASSVSTGGAVSNIVTLDPASIAALCACICACSGGGGVTPSGAQISVFAGGQTVVPGMPGTDVIIVLPTTDDDNGSWVVGNTLKVPASVAGRILLTGGMVAAISGGGTLTANCYATKNGVGISPSWAGETIVSAGQGPAATGSFALRVLVAPGDILALHAQNTNVGDTYSIDFAYLSATFVG